MATELESMRTLMKNQLSERDLAAQGAYFCGTSVFPHIEEASSLVLLGLGLLGLRGRVQE